MKRKELGKNSFFRFKRFSHKAYSAFSSMHKVVNIGVVTACILTFANATETAAQTVAAEQHPEGELAEQELDEVTVTASLIETPLSQTAKLVTVITKETIAQAPVQSIQDLLNYIAGIDVIQRGGHGVQADISIRGGSADQTAILLNGVNLSNPHTGHYSFDIPINLSDIERIEILDGPSALIYGSSAFSGGINIITKKKEDSKLYAQLEAGMYNSQNAEIRSAIDTKHTNNSLSFGYQKSDGYISNSDYDIYNALWQTRLKIKDDSRIDFMAGYNNKSYGANTFYSALYPNQYDRTSEYVGAINGVFGKKLKFIPQLYWTRHYDQFDLIKDTDKGRNYHRSDTYGANMMFQYTSKIGVTHFGGELRREDILSSKLGKPMAEPHGKYTMYDGRTLTNIVIEHTKNWEKFILSAGALASYNTLQNDKMRIYPSASIAYRPTHQLKIYTTWSRSSRLPTFTDLGYTTETHIANETLQAENSETYDLGATYTNNYFNAKVVCYIMNGHNMIDWVRESGNDKWASWNFTEVKKRGIEAQVNIPLYRYISLLGTSSTLSLNYAHMNQDCDSKGLESKYTLNYLRDKFTTQLNHQIFKGLSASWFFRFQKRMGSYRKYEGTTDMGLYPYPAFSTLDLKLEYKYRHTVFHVAINNLYDTNYYDIGNVPQPGFWFMGGVSYKL